jgi:hypothetical protein
LRKRKRYRNLTIGSPPSKRLRSRAEQLLLRLDIEDQGSGTWDTPLELLREIAFDEQAEIAQGSAISLTLRHVGPWRSARKLGWTGRQINVTSAFIRSTIKKQALDKWQPGLFHVCHWHDAIMKGDHDAALALLLMILPKLKAVSLNRNAIGTERTDGLVALIAGPKPTHGEQIDLAILRNLRTVKNLSKSWACRRMTGWASLPIEHLELSHVNSQDPRLSMWHSRPSNLTSLTILNGKLHSGDFSALWSKLKSLKHVNYHASPSLAKAHRWNCNIFFQAIVRELHSTLETLEVGLGTWYLEPHWWGSVCSNMLDKCTRLRHLTVDCNMLYDYVPTGPSRTASAPVLAFGLLEHGERQRFLPRSIESLTIRDQNTGQHSKEDYCKSHREFTSAFLTGSPESIREAYPNLQTIYNIVDMEDTIRGGLQSVNIDFESRKYAWEP